MGTQQKNRPGDEDAKRIARERMRAWRKRNKTHARTQYRRAYWRKKGLPYYDGVALGGMETSNDLRAEVRRLREQLHRWNFEYYVWNAPTVTDAEFDRAMERLQTIEREHPELQDSTSPTQRVGCPEISVFAKVEHKVRMLSLDKVKTVQGVVEFFEEYEDTEGMVEPKIDGSSLSVFYVNGRMVRAVTRGDGSRGDEVTMNARTIRTLPLELPERITLEVRGEVFIKWSHFAEHNARLEAEGEDPAANPRNAAAGALKLKDSHDSAKVPLSFIAYSTTSPLKGVATHRDVLERLEELGFVTTSALPLPVSDCTSMTQFDLDLANKGMISEIVHNLDHARTLQDFPTDGLVFKLSSLDLQEELGSSTTAPNWAVAFKYPPERVKTKLIGVEFTVGKTGKITPVGEFEPVVVSGTTVARANLCNLDEIHRLKLGLNDIVVLEKSNEIIPKVNSVAESRSRKLIEWPKRCPACKAKLDRPEGLVDFFCQNPHCDAQYIAKLVYATGKNALDVQGCGQKTVEELAKRGVKGLDALFAKTGFKFLKSDAARKKIEGGLKKALKAPLWRKLAALCIEGWGKTTCQEVAARWLTIFDIIDALDKKELEGVIGPAKSKTFRAKLHSHRDMIAELDDLGFWEVDKDAKAGPLAGQVFCLTGKMTDCENRLEVEDAVVERGGLCKSSVSRKVHYLVVGEGPGATKLAAAKRLGTPALTPDELYDMMKWRPTL